MAITPDECFELSTDESQILATLEIDIDEFLRENFNGDFVVGRFSLKKPLNTRMFTAIKNLYYKSGWKVTPATISEDDMRGLDSNSYYLDFEPLKKITSSIYAPGTK